MSENTNNLFLYYHVIAKIQIIYFFIEVLIEEGVIRRTEITDSIIDGVNIIECNNDQTDGRDNENEDDPPHMLERTPVWIRLTNKYSLALSVKGGGKGIS